MAEASTPATTESQQTGVEWNVLESVGKFLFRGDIILALCVVAILVVLILPMPKSLLDISLAFSITFSVLILMTALFVERPLQFNTFPTVLLLATMVRLSLNLASTRLILADGHLGADAAGKGGTPADYKFVYIISVPLHRDYM